MHFLILRNHEIMLALQILNTGKLHLIHSMLCKSTLEKEASHTLVELITQLNNLIQWRIKEL